MPFYFFREKSPCNTSNWVASAVVQIVLQRNGVDPDPLGLSLDVDRIIESYTDKEKLLHIESQVWAAR